MKQYLFIAILLLASLQKLSAQQSPNRYLLVALYTNDAMDIPDTVTHQVSIYGKNKQPLKQLGAGVFHTADTCQLRELTLLVDGKKIHFPLNARAWRNRFIVLKAHINKQASAKAVNLSVRNGDVIYLLKECKENCHTIRVTLPKVYVVNEQLTTGYQSLDKYVLDEK